MPIFHEQRIRLRNDLVQKLRAIAPRLELHSREQWMLCSDYNMLLDEARALADVVLDDLEREQEAGRGEGAIDHCHYFWSRLSLVDLSLPTRSVVRDADLLEALPVDA